jgi:hypothetical protein
MWAKPECPCCGKIYKGKIPDDVKKQGRFGLNFAAAIVSIKMSDMSFRLISEFFLNFLGISISTFCLTNAFIKASQSLEEPYKEVERVQEPRTPQRRRNVP